MSRDDDDGGQGCDFRFWDGVGHIWHCQVLHFQAGFDQLGWSCPGLSSPVPYRSWVDPRGRSEHYNGQWYNSKVMKLTIMNFIHNIDMFTRCFYKGLFCALKNVEISRWLPLACFDIFGARDAKVSVAGRFLSCIPAN